uniref:Uncharacterized protein n=1 Tax=Strigops habroptila TaxID=2489341 RepID=A0A672UR55_STRHB
MGHQVNPIGLRSQWDIRSTPLCGDPPMSHQVNPIVLSQQGRGRALVLRAEALGVCPTAAPQVEQTLSRAVKLDPGLASAWIRLGELKWGQGDLEGARACFMGALAHVSAGWGGFGGGFEWDLGGFKRGLEGLEGSRREFRGSLAQAEAAVRCDPRDGASWYVLGNAYVSLFFAGGQSPEAARRALGAYAQAERVDPEAANNPDLHLNRATLLQYEERFGAALEGLSRAAALAPGWAEPRRRHAHLLDFLSRLCAALANRVRGRLGVTPRGSGGGGQWGHLGGWGGAVGLADGAGGVAALTVYNAAPDWGVAVGDAVAVPRPCLKHHVHQHHGQVRGGDGGCGGALWVRTGLYWSELVLPPLIPPRRRSPSRGCGFRRRSHSSSTGAAPRAPRWPLRASCCALTPRRLRPPRPDQSAAAVAALRRRLRLKGAMAGAVLGGGSVGAAILGETVEEEAAILEQAAGSVEGAMLGGSMGAAILGEVFVLQ